MMNHLVPDFGMDDDYSIPTSAGLSRPRKSSMADDEIMELLWQNGQVVMQSQNQRSGLKKSPLPSRIVVEDAILPAGQSTSKEILSTSTSAPPPTEDASATHLFMQEDEMASWLHYPLDDTSFDRDFCADFLYPTPCAATATTTATPPAAAAVRTTMAAEHRPPPMTMSARPPIPPVRVATTTEVDSSRFSNFVHFSRMKGRAESGPSDSNKGVRESTVVDSSDTPAVGHDSRVSQLAGSTTGEIGDIAGRGGMSGDAVAGTSSAGGGSRGDMVTCDMTVTSSPGGSGASVSASADAEPAQKPPAEVRKRKARRAAADDTDCYSEDVEFEPADAKKQVHGSSSTKRSRAAEVHNLSERRRRDRINEKMKALQELIPRCNKSDKASMLDEAIEYLKSLQLQVQMMSMGCSMVPMMFPGVQQYMPPMGMGMGMGMGMDMSMSRPMMPFPSVLGGSAMQTPSAAAHLGPRFPMPAYHMQPVPAPDPSRIQATHQSDHMLNPLATQNLNQPQVPNFADPYQRYFGLHQMQLPLRQNQAMAQPGTSKPSTSGGAESVEHHQSG